MMDVESALEKVRLREPTTAGGRYALGWVKVEGESRFQAGGQIMFFQPYRVQKYEAHRMVGLRIKRTLEWWLDPSGKLHLLPVDPQG